MSGYDVVVVGSGVAGPTAAVLLARRGVRVALLEAHLAPGHDHPLRGPLPSGAASVLRRLGIDARGRTRGPLLQELAATTTGVDLLLGTEVRGLLRDVSGRVAGVRVRQGRAVRELVASLVVGADGRASTVAERAGLADRGRSRPAAPDHPALESIRARVGAAVRAGAPRGPLVVPGLALVGDAAGVHAPDRLGLSVALRTAARLADEVGTALAGGAAADPDREQVIDAAVRRYGRSQRRLLGLQRPWPPRVEPTHRADPADPRDEPPEQLTGRPAGVRMPGLSSRDVGRESQ